LEVVVGSQIFFRSTTGNAVIVPTRKIKRMNLSTNDLRLSIEKARSSYYSVSGKMESRFRDEYRNKIIPLIQPARMRVLLEMRMILRALLSQKGLG
jgi:hypothetical protein